MSDDQKLGNLVAALCQTNMELWRQEDIARLPDDSKVVQAKRNVDKLNQKHGTRVTNVSPEALDALLAHRWEGNVRELRNVIERAVILAGDGPITKEHFVIHARPAAIKAVNGALEIAVGMTVDEAERVLIEATLKQTNNNKTRAAAVLGISAKTLGGNPRVAGGSLAARPICRCACAIRVNESIMSKTFLP